MKINFRRFKQALIFLSFSLTAIYSSAVPYTSPGFYSGDPPPTQYILNCQGCPITTDKLLQQLAQRGVEIIQVGDTLEIILGVDRFFMPKSNTRLRYNQVETMKIVSRFLKTRGNVPITVYGHTDEVGSDQSKLHRSKQQAETIAAYIWSNGIPLRNVRAIGCGDTEPVSSNQIVDGSSANRRIEIITG
jgi:outer membrane protein OmpA-like peptidoglycan-associated protein